MLSLTILLPMLATLMLTPYAIPYLLYTRGTAYYPLLVVQCFGILFEINHVYVLKTVVDIVADMVNVGR